MEVVHNHRVNQVDAVAKLRQRFPQSARQEIIHKSSAYSVAFVDDPGDTNCPKRSHETKIQCVDDGIFANDIINN
jgi:hypothetical protein